MSLPITEWLFDTHSLESHLLSLRGDEGEFIAARVWLDPRKALVGLPGGLFPLPSPGFKQEYLSSLSCLQSNLLRAACLTLELRRLHLLEGPSTVVALMVNPDYGSLGRRKDSLLPLGTRSMTEAKRQVLDGGGVATWRGGFAAFGKPGSGKAGLLLVTESFISKVRELVHEFRSGSLSYLQPERSKKKDMKGRPPRARVIRHVSSEVLRLLEAQARTLEASYLSMGEEVTLQRVRTLLREEYLSQEQRGFLEKVTTRATRQGDPLADLGPTRLDHSSALHESNLESLDKVRILYPELLEYRRLDREGRFHAPFQSALRREERPTLTFHGQRTIELDYGSLHPRMLAHRVGMTGLPEDLYPALEGWPREVVKVAVNVLLNARSTAEGVGAISSRSKASKKARAAVLRLADSVGLGAEADALFGDFTLPRFPEDRVRSLAESLAANPYFGSFLGQSAWIECQRLDARIAEEVMLAFLRNERPILSLHDSFRVLATDEALLREVMVEKYKEVVGTNENPVVK